MQKYLLLLAILSVCSAHICLLDPPQSWGAPYNVSTPGNRACVKPTAPCGSGSSTGIAKTLVTGSGESAFVVQNLNHYNPGRHGFIQIGFFNGPNPTSDDDFIPLKIVRDYQAWNQWTVTNLSIPFTVPDTPCDHCVIQVIYHPNHQQEPVFHQCTDVKIVAPSDASSTSTNIHAFMTVGQGWDENEIQIVTVSNDGSIESLITLETNFHYDTLVAGRIVASSSSSDLTRVLYAINPADADWKNGKGSSQISWVDSTGQANTVPFSLSNLDEVQAVLDVPKPAQASDDLYVVGNQCDNSGSNCTYSLNTLNPQTGALSASIIETQLESYYIDFFNAEIDMNNGDPYVLVVSHYENTITGLDLAFWKLPLKPSTSSPVPPTKVSKNGPSIITLTSVNGVIYALSPGDFRTQNPSQPLRFRGNWKLLTLDGNGNIIKQVAVTGGNQEGYTGRAEFVSGQGWLNTNQGSGTEIAVMFQRITAGGFGAHEIAFVDAASGNIVRSVVPDLGVNNAYSLHSLTALP